MWNSTFENVMQIFYHFWKTSGINVPEKEAFKCWVIYWIYVNTEKRGFPWKLLKEIAIAIMWKALTWMKDENNIFKLLIMSHQLGKLLIKWYS